MIQMIRGVTSISVDGILKRMDKNSAPFDASPEQEERLIRLGMAVRVDDDAPIGFDEMPPEDDADLDDIEVDEADVVEDEIDLETLTAKELREIGAEYGLTFKANASRASMIEAIKKAEADVDYLTEDDGEPAPTFDASEAVL